MNCRELDRLLRLRANKPGFDLKNPVHRTALIWDLLPLFNGRERVELVVREMIPDFRPEVWGEHYPLFGEIG